MRYFSPQHKKGFIRFIGCVVIPLVLTAPLLYFGIRDYNITGLLNLDGYGLFFHVLAGILLIWMDVLLYRVMKKERISSRYLIILNILILIALTVPYQEGLSLMNTVHITAAYAAFVFFVCLFACLLRLYPKHLLCFIMICIFCIFLCLGAGKVTGLAEVVFGSSVSILLSLLF